MAENATTFAGLHSGRFVNFVLKSGGIRPLLVTVAWTFAGMPTGIINGIVFRDGSNDDGEFSPVQVPAVTEGMSATEAGATVISVRLAEWVTSVEYDAEAKPGTWHWPAKSTSIVLAALDWQLMEYYIKTICAKLAAHGINLQLDEDGLPCEPEEPEPAGFSPYLEPGVSEIPGSGSERYGQSRPDYQGDAGDEHRAPLPMPADTIKQPPAGHPGASVAVHPLAPEVPKTATQANRMADHQFVPMENIADPGAQRCSVDGCLLSESAHPL